MKVSVTFDGKELDWRNMHKKELEKFADEMNMQTLIPMGYRVKQKDSKKTA